MSGLKVRRELRLLPAAALTLPLVVPTLAFAGGIGGGGGMPYSAALQTIIQSMTGEVAEAATVVGLVGGGAMLMAGTEFTWAPVWLLKLVFIGSLLMGAAQLFATLGVGGSVV
jgi:type IV secretory pathway VirB2 component (pilin)